MPRGYSRENTCVHLMNYHFVFCPKYRKHILVDKVKMRLEELIGKKDKGIRVRDYRAEL